MTSSSSHNSSPEQIIGNLINLKYIRRHNEKVHANSTSPRKENQPHSVEANATDLVNCVNIRSTSAIGNTRSTILDENDDTLSCQELSKAKETVVEDREYDNDCKNESHSKASLANNNVVFDRAKLLERGEKLGRKNITKLFFTRISPTNERFKEFCFVHERSLREAFHKLVNHACRVEDSNSSEENADAVYSAAEQSRMPRSLNVQAAPFLPKAASNSLPASSSPLSITIPAATVIVDPKMTTTTAKVAPSKCSSFSRSRASHPVSRRCSSVKPAATSSSIGAKNRLHAESQMTYYMKKTLDEMNAVRLNNLNYFEGDYTYVSLSTDDELNITTYARTTASDSSTSLSTCNRATTATSIIAAGCAVTPAVGQSESADVMAAAAAAVPCDSTIMKNETYAATRYEQSTCVSQRRDIFFQNSPGEMTNPVAVGSPPTIWHTGVPAEVSMLVPDSHRIPAVASGDTTDRGRLLAQQRHHPQSSAPKFIDGSHALQCQYREPHATTLTDSSLAPQCQYQQSPTNSSLMQHRQHQQSASTQIPTDNSFVPQPRQYQQSPTRNLTDGSHGQLRQYQQMPTPRIIDGTCVVQPRQHHRSPTPQLSDSSLAQRQYQQATFPNLGDQSLAQQRQYQRSPSPKLTGSPSLLSPLDSVTFSIPPPPLQLSLNSSQRRANSSNNYTVAAPPGIPVLVDRGAPSGQNCGRVIKNDIVDEENSSVVSAQPPPSLPHLDYETNRAVVQSISNVVVARENPIRERGNVDMMDPNANFGSYRSSNNSSNPLLLPTPSSGVVAPFQRSLSYDGSEAAKQVMRPVASDVISHHQYSAASCEIGSAAQQPVSNVSTQHGAAAKNAFATRSTCDVLSQPLNSIDRRVVHDDVTTSPSLNISKRQQLAPAPRNAVMPQSTTFVHQEQQQEQQQQQQYPVRKASNSTMRPVSDVVANEYPPCDARNDAAIMQSVSNSLPTRQQVIPAGQFVRQIFAAIGDHAQRAESSSFPASMTVNGDGKSARGNFQPEKVESPSYVCPTNQSNSIVFDYETNNRRFSDGEIVGKGENRIPNTVFRDQERFFSSKPGMKTTNVENNNTRVFIDTNKGRSRTPPVSF